MPAPTTHRPDASADPPPPGPRPGAAALRYEPPGDAAPRVVARGWGDVARRILEVARQHDVPIREDADLLAVLARLDLDREVPPDLYKPIAEVLAFVYRVNRKAKNR